MPALCVSDAIKKAYNDYLDESIDSDVTGKPILRKSTYPYTPLGEYFSVVPFSCGYNAGRTAVPCLMGAGNAHGWKLEELAPQLAAEISDKTKRIEHDTRIVAQTVQANNRQIIMHLLEIERLQRASYAALATLGPDEGPLGSPRIGGAV